MVEPILEISGLSKNFGALRATDNVSLDLRPGEIHALIGPNGAGKSTLIHQIAGTLKPDDGVIRFLGREVNEAGPAARARMGLGRSFQVSSLAPEFSGELARMNLTSPASLAQNLEQFARKHTTAGCALVTVLREAQ